MVKGKTSHQKIAIPVSTLSKPELQPFYSCLFDLKYVCQKCTSLIDSSEDLTVSFSVYNGLKQLGDLNLDSKEDQIILELEHV